MSEIVPSAEQGKQRSITPRKFKTFMMKHRLTTMENG